MIQALQTFTIRDTRGRRSKTLFMVWTCLIVLLIKFCLGGLDIGFGEFPVITAGEFGLAATGIVGVWVYRDNKAKKLEQQRQGKDALP